MANTASAAKRARQTTTRTLVNKRVTSAIRTRLKGVRTSIKAGGKEAAVAATQKLSSALDKAAKGGKIHRNKANRLKSRTAKALSVLK